VEVEDDDEAESSEDDEAAGGSWGAANWTVQDDDGNGSDGSDALQLSSRELLSDWAERRPADVRGTPIADRSGPGARGNGLGWMGKARRRRGWDELGMDREVIGAVAFAASLHTLRAQAAVRLSASLCTCSSG